MSGAKLGIQKTGGRALALRLARALLPAWRFFDTIEPAPRLSVRAAGQDAASWTEVLPAPVGSFARMVFNPAGNLALAQQSLLEQLLSDVAEPALSTPEQVEALTSYRLVCRLAREHARRIAPTAESFQFKLALDDTEDLLVSSVLPL